ncbi:hypothetical protein [Devosia nitrariae]|uniref:Uncharacterized protein n=1 Tax=Devosia nitrariae TaxID=2071872 RepID=A0ABQ5WB10_9HYPH|nr:hypothetical protein [Devosia nitrariae]GLQ57287.1 hypothetical protein GCM10010862_45460 [Devosia nitrariae]
MANDDALWRARSRIFALADRTNTLSDLEDAATNLIEGRPAFWTNAQFGNQPATLFKATVNRLASIKAAQAELSAHFTRNRRNVLSPDWLDTLLPLNPAALADLLSAYRRAGSFRTAEELLRRTERAEGLDTVEVAA